VLLGKNPKYTKEKDQKTTGKFCGRKSELDTLKKKKKQKKGHSPRKEEA